MATFYYSFRHTYIHTHTPWACAHDYIDITYWVWCCFVSIWFLCWPLGTVVFIKGSSLGVSICPCQQYLVICSSLSMDGAPWHLPYLLAPSLFRTCYVVCCGINQELASLSFLADSLAADFLVFSLLHFLAAFLSLVFSEHSVQKSCCRCIWGADHPMMACSLYFDQGWFPITVSNCCKGKLPWESGELQLLVGVRRSI